MLYRRLELSHGTSYAGTIETPKQLALVARGAQLAE
jgi:hypothetical protein